MKYKTIVAVRNIADSTVSIASRFATKAANAAHAADVKAKAHRTEANNAKLTAARVAADRAREALSKQVAAYAAEADAIAQAHPFV